MVTAAGGNSVDSPIESPIAITNVQLHPSNGVYNKHTHILTWNYVPSTSTVPSVLDLQARVTCHNKKTSESNHVMPCVIKCVLSHALITNTSVSLRNDGTWSTTAVPNYTLTQKDETYELKSKVEYKFL